MQSSVVSFTEADRADWFSSRALFACLVREIGQVHQTVEWAHDHLVLRLPTTGHVLRAQVATGSTELAPRFLGPVEQCNGNVWEAIDVAVLSAFASAELTAVTGVVNVEFEQQVIDGREALASILIARQQGIAPIDPYLSSEQALLAGHPRHPTPKARQGKTDEWLSYAPEVHARFPLLYLAVRHDALRETRSSVQTLSSALLEDLCPALPSNEHFALPVHPWQWKLLQGHPNLQAALDDGRLTFLGFGDHHVVPTSSLRTVYLPEVDAFFKLSLEVRITNCLRKLAWYELAGATTLTDALIGPFADIRRHCPDASLLLEPLSRTASLDPSSDGRGDLRTFEGLGMILREGLQNHLRPEVTGVLAGALIEDHPSATLPHDLSTARRWWSSYVALVMTPVLLAYVHHGIVLESHLQNVIIGMDSEHLPTQAIFRDLEGTKLIPGTKVFETLPSSLPEQIVGAMTYQADQAWNRVAYCLFVNNLAEVGTAISIACPSLASSIWPTVAEQLRTFVEKHGATSQLLGFLEKDPLPVKANLSVRWARHADRLATYLPFSNPLHLNPLHSSQRTSAKQPLESERDYRAS